MTVEVVCGINWGDEGKGRMVDYLARGADVVVRYQGGNNAGHTVINQYGTFALHLVPSGVFWAGTLNVLGPGMVIDLQGLNAEIDKLEAAGVRCDSLRVSDRATILFPFHRDEDTWEEERLGAAAFGSTKNGIAPAYGDRHLKWGVQIGELRFPRRLEQRIRALTERKNQVAERIYGKGRCYDPGEMVRWARTHGQRLEQRICDTTQLLHSLATQDKRILFEAQLGALRDLFFGIYPFTTSSCTLASHAPVGGGLFGHPVDRVVGVMKAFSTCVGEGPFVTVMTEDEAGRLREAAHEYGATTGRPRRIGHFDAVASRFGVQVQGATELALTKLDSLSGRDRLKICTHYEVGGDEVSRFPLTPMLDEARPVYVELDGWQGDVSGCRRFEDLPAAARRYVRTIEESVACRIRFVSVGPERESLIELA